MKINNIDYTIYKQYGTNENSKIKKHSKSLEEVIKHFVAVDNKHGDYISNVITTGDAVYVSFNGNSDLVPLWYVLNLAYHYHLILLLIVERKHHFAYYFHQMIILDYLNQLFFYLSHHN